MDRIKANGETQLNEKRVKIANELTKLKQRADAFSDYGELDMIQQYVNDVRNVQKRLADVQEQITWINKEEVLYKFQVTQSPEVEEITTAIDPYMKVFQTISRWQKVEKK